jgi:GTP-binding protein Era
MGYRSGFVNILGKPNAGKSTLLNALLGEKLAITSPKVQTTRHRILGILNRQDAQIVFSDTPGIIDPDYKLHERMMSAVKKAVEDADVAVLLVDATDRPELARDIFSSLHIKAPRILVINKTDLATSEQVVAAREAFSEGGFAAVQEISALTKENLDQLLDIIVGLMPEGLPYYPDDMLTERPVRFFVAELIREKIYELYREEIPYHTTVLITRFEEKNTLTKISAEVIVQRETQKGIILGEKGKAIKKLGERSRADIEAFIDRKVFLELHVKVRDKWRDKDQFLREYGYS